MFNAHNHQLKAINLLAMLATAILLGLLLTGTSSASPQAPQVPKWLRNLPSAPTCPGGDINCHRSSPAIADVDGDGIDDIIVGTATGHVIAIKDDGSSNGAIIFDVDLGPIIGVGANNAVISSSPAVADIDNNDGGFPEIAIGFGYEIGSATRGGMIVLEHTGAVKSGWPKMSIGTHSNGNPMAVFSTPALGDLDKDGDLEIVYASVDKRIYARHHNGSMLPGFTPDSHHLERFPAWGDLVGRLADTIWGSPVLADLDGNGYLDIILTTDEGNFDARYGGDANGWTCPYALPPGWAEGYCGGALYALDRHGNILPGFPKYILEIFQSTPAVMDTDGDGLPEIFVGTGAFYHYHSPDHPTHGFRFFGFDNDGSDLPGWSGGKLLNNVAPNSPAIGDIAGDSKPELIIGDATGRIHAFTLTGQPVAGFPMIARSSGNGISSFDVGESFLLADTDNDGKMEIITQVRDSIVIVDGNGQQITSKSNGTDGKPSYRTGGWMINTPAVGDVDGDGDLELIAMDSTLVVWDLPAGSTDSQWPMFKNNAARLGSFASPGALGDVSDEVIILQDPIEPIGTVGLLAISNEGDSTLDWSIDPDSLAADVQFSITSGTLNGHESIIIDVVVLNGATYPDGWNDLGDAEVETFDGMGEPAGEADIPIMLFVGEIYQAFMPHVFNK